MIPGNTFTVTPIVSPYPYPDSLPYDPLSQIVNGGLALNDATHGRLYQYWNASYDGTRINIKPVGGAVAMSLAETGVLTVSLAFDINMQPTLAWTTLSGAYLYYYDTITQHFIRTYYPGYTSCRVSVDDAANYYSGQSDVIFGYTAANVLYYRQQRDRYLFPYFIGNVRGVLRKLGLNLGSRLQFQVF